MKERREFERFALMLPARMEMITSGKRLVFDVRAMNISAGGAFLLTKDDFPEGTRCQLEMSLPSDRIKEITGAQSLIKAEGVVVRTTPAGVAVCFDGECQILGLKG